jgi:hypothetical protein
MLTLPLPRPTVTRFGVGGWPGVGFRFDVVGRASPVGQIVRKVASDGSMAVTLSTTAVASMGMPARPATGRSNVAPEPSLPPA